MINESSTSTSDTSSEDFDHYEDVGGLFSLSCYSNGGPGLKLRNDYGAVNKDIIYKQFVQNVVDFSSQYGTDYSISYTAFNITGKPSKFPDYGDFPETYAMVSDSQSGWLSFLL